MTRRGGGELTGVLLTLILLTGAYYYFTTQAANNLIGVELTLTYADGSTDTFNLPTNLLGQAVVNPATNKVITKIDYTIQAVTTWTGNIEHLAVVGSNDLYLKVGTATPVLKQGNPIAYSTTTGLGTVGAGTFTVKTGSLLTSTLEAWDLSPGSKTLQFMVSLDATMKTVTIGDADSFKHAEATVSFAYSVVNEGITGLSISMVTTPS